MTSSINTSIIQQQKADSFLLWQNRSGLSEIFKEIVYLIDFLLLYSHKLSDLNGSFETHFETALCCHYLISSVIRQSFFILPKQSLNLDPSYKMDLDL